MAETAEDFLSHYGVKGMRWGKRRSSVSSAPRAEGYTDRMLKTDRKYVGKKGINKVNEKVASGTDLAKARKEVKDAKAVRDVKVRTAVALGAYAAIKFGPVIVAAAEMGLNEAVMAKKKSNGKKAADRMFADNRSRSHGLSTGPTIRLQQNPTTGNWI